MSNSYDSRKPSFSQEPPEAWKPLFRLSQFARRPLERFLHIEAASGILLMVAAAIALFLANSSWSTSYFQFWKTIVGIRLGGFEFQRSLEWIVNDGLMVIFFFVVGLEIRREIHHGELSEWRRAALPFAAALGGMLVPAILYLLMVNSSAAKSGWGIPMATDIAFAVGILTLLGKRVPAALRVLLLAVAVIDDLGAILVIAIFYSSEFSLFGLMTAVGGICGVFLMQWIGIRSKLLYVVPSFIAWGGIYAAGVHPTIAGVIVGLITPVRAWLGTEGLQHVLHNKLEMLSESTQRKIPSHEVAETLREVSLANREALSPSESLITILHPWVAFLIMPIFALANAGVTLPSGTLDERSWGVAVAITVGLIFGKPLGVLFASWMILRLGIGTLPIGVTYRHLIVLGIVAGIGFTMSLFIAQLAFTDESLLAAAKLGILVASICAAGFGLLIGHALLTPESIARAARTADEAEKSTEY